MTDSATYTKPGKYVNYKPILLNFVKNLLQKA
jgi:hypothetical protein